MRKSIFTQCLVAIALMAGSQSAFAKWEVLNEEKATVLTNNEVSMRVTEARNKLRIENCEDKNIEKLDLSESSFEYNGKLYHIVSICENAFADCKNLRTVKLGDDIETINNCAFEGCESLEQFFIPESVHMLGANVFSGCTNMQKIFVSRSSRLLNSSITALSGSLGCNATVYVPQGCIDQYKEADNWKNVKNMKGMMLFRDSRYFSDAKVLENGFEEIEHVTCEYGSNELSISAIRMKYSDGVDAETMEKNNEKIGCVHLMGNTDLSVDIFDEDGNQYVLTVIGEIAFMECECSNIILPNTLKTIGKYAFKRSQLTTIKIPESVTQIGSGAFEKCEYLTSVELPSSMETIPYFSFYGCKSLQSVYIPNSVTSIGGYAFGASGLTTVTIPGSVENISDCAFENCENLSTMILLGENTEIECSCYDDFVTIPRTTTVYVPASAYDNYKKTDWAKNVAEVRVYGETAAKTVNNNIYDARTGEKVTSTVAGHMYVKNGVKFIAQ